MKPHETKEFSDKIISLASQATADLLHLHRVTGKWGITNIDPLSEKRWSDRCWVPFSRLVQLNIMVSSANFRDTLVERFIADIRPKDSWVGHVSPGKIPSSYPRHSHERKTS